MRRSRRHCLMAAIGPWTAIIVGERIQRAYDVMVNASDADTDPVAGIKGLREGSARRQVRGGSRFSLPTARGGIPRGRRGHLFNFRPDRARQMTRVFTDKEFDGFGAASGSRLSHFVTMTEYPSTFDVEVAFPKTFPRERPGRRYRRQWPEAAAHRRDREVRPRDVLPQRRHRGAQGGRGSACSSLPPRSLPTICSLR